jgi:hypothetical protein
MIRHPSSFSNIKQASCSRAGWQHDPLGLPDEATTEGNAGSGSLNLIIGGRFYGTEGQPSALAMVTWTVPEWRAIRQLAVKSLV